MKPSSTSIKLNLNLAVQRIKLLVKKKEALRHAACKEVSELLAKGKEESARIKTEQIIKEDYYIEALEMVDIYCQLVSGRFGLLENTSQLDLSLREAVMNIVYAAPVTGIKELNSVREAFVSKYGKDFALACQSHAHEAINAKLVRKLSVATPDPGLVEQYLVEIAAFYEVHWRRPAAAASTVPLQKGDPVQIDPSIRRAMPASTHSPSPEGLGLPSPPQSHPRSTLSSVPPGTADFDELTRRFEALKKRK